MSYFIDTAVLLELERQKREQRENQRPFLQLPLPEPPPEYWDQRAEVDDTEDDSDPERGMIIIEM
jgi:hypothetical protein